MNILQKILFSTLVLGVCGSAALAQVPHWQRTNGAGGAEITGISFDSSGGVYVISNNVFHSTNGGLTWEQLPQNPSDIHTLPNGHLVALLNTNQVCISTDQGHSWIPILDERGSIAVTATGALYVYTAAHLFRTFNESISWDTLPPPPQMINARFTAFYTSTIFINGDYFYRSTDQGNSWSKIINGITVENSWGNQLMGTSGGILCYVAGDGRYYSSDDGRTWKKLSNDGAKRVAISTRFIGTTSGGGLNFYDLQGIFIKSISSPINEGNFLGTDVSPIGEFWAWFGPYIFKVNPKTDSEFSPIILPNGIVTEIIAPATGAVIVNSKGLYEGGWYSTTNKGDSWKVIPKTFISPAASDSLHNFFAINSEVISKSTDAGISWNIISPHLSPTLTSIVIDKRGFLYVGSTEGVFRTTDGGNTWDQLNSGLSDKNILSLAVNSGGEIFAGTTNTIFQSTNNGLVWMALPFVPPDNSGISTLLYSNNSLLAVVKNFGVFRSQDNGQSWSPIGSKLFAKVNTLMDLPGGYVFAGTNQGVFYLGAGSAWTQANIGLGNLNVLCMTHDPQNTIFLGTEGSGVFRSVQPFNKIESEINYTSTSTIYPNPSHGEITVDIPGIQNAKIEVLDLLGRIVATDVASEKWVWKSNQTSGTYILNVKGIDKSGKSLQSYDRFIIE